VSEPVYHSHLADKGEASRKLEAEDVGCNFYTNSIFNPWLSGKMWLNDHEFHALGMKVPKQDESIKSLTGRLLIVQRQSLHILSPSNYFSPKPTSSSSIQGYRSYPHPMSPPFPVSSYLTQTDDNMQNEYICRPKKTERRNRIADRGRRKSESTVSVSSRDRRLDRLVWPHQWGQVRLVWWEKE